MSTSKYFDRIAAAVMVLGLLLTALFLNGEALGIEKIADEDAEQYETASLFTANDQNGDWDASKATATITLNGDGAKIRGNGAYYNDGSVVITGAGYYVVSGALDDGNLVVDAYDSSKVFLLLDGVSLYCSDDACLRVEQAQKVFLTLAAGTENRMESGASYSETALADKTGGTIFTHDDLTINGSGSLTIVANYKHGVDANDDLVVTGGTISVTAPEDGLHVNDSFRMMAASLTIAAGDDGIHSDTDIYIESGALRVTECYEGLEALRIEVAGGDIEIYPSDDGFNANGGSGGFGGGGMMGGGFGGGRRGEFAQAQEGGEMPTMPDGAQFTPPEGGTQEMPDGAQFAPPEGFDGGERPERGGSDGTMPEGGADASDGGEDEETYIRISCGNILIVNENARDADGLDSNGDLYITGGTILVSLNGDGSNNAVDYGSESGGVAEISGGTIIACGGASMAESFNESSAQPSIAYAASVVAGARVALRDAAGNLLLDWTVPCSFTYLTLSCPEMTVGGTYTLTLGESEEEITLESVVTTLGDSAGMGGFGGGGMMGGMGGRPDGENAGGFGGHGRRGEETAQEQTTTGK